MWLPWWVWPSVRSGRWNTWRILRPCGRRWRGGRPVDEDIYDGLIVPRWTTISHWNPVMNNDFNQNYEFFWQMSLNTKLDFMWESIILEQIITQLDITIDFMKSNICKHISAKYVEYIRTFGWQKWTWPLAQNSQAKQPLRNTKHSIKLDIFL